MKITEACQALRDKKTINCANTRENIKAQEKEGELWVTCTDPDNVKQEMRLVRFEQLYRAHAFAEGQFKADKKDTAAT